MNKIKLSEERVNEIREDALNEYKEMQGRDLRGGLMVLAGLALYIYTYEKLGIFWMLAIFIATLVIGLLVASVLGKK